MKKKTIWTSYFAKSGKEPNAVSIARSSPTGYSGEAYKSLAPPPKLLYEWKKGVMSPSLYTEIYKEEVLDKLDPKIVGSLLVGKILLCWEGSGKFCHRHLVAEWLKDNGFEVKEIYP